MHPELTDEQTYFRDTSRRYLEKETPLTAVRALYDSPDGFDRDWWRKVAQLGWTSMFVPEAHGGGSISGRPVADAVIVAEEMGRMVAPGPFLPVSVVADALAQGGAHGEILAGLLSGEVIAAWAFAEFDGNWDGSKIATTVSRDGSDYVLNGEKRFVEAVAVADYLLVTATANEGLTQIIVRADAPGLTIRPGRSIDMTRRVGAVVFDNVRVPTGALVGAFGEAGLAVTRQRAIAIALQCAELIGIADRAFEFTLAYGANRYAFGRAIVSYQAIKHRAADLLVTLEGSKAVTDELARLIDEVDPGVDRMASVAKAYVGQACLTAVDECVQITGGIGVTWEHDLHLYNRRAALNHVLFGTPQEHKRRVVESLRQEAA